MTNLSFDYDSRADEPRAYSQGFTIRAVRDDDSECPWTAWDLNVPLLAYSDRSLTTYGNDYGIEAPLAAMSDGFIARHQKAIAKILDVDWQAMHDDARGDAKHYRNVDVISWKRDHLESALSDIHPGTRGYGATDYMAALESLWTLLGVPCLNTCSQGYSQGCYADLLFVATPEFVKATGNKKGFDWQADMKAACDLWGAWAWGDVYGFVIEDSEGNHVDACFGFYGSDFDKSGLSEAASRSLEYHIAAIRQNRQSRLKELIRNRVPLASRAAELESASHA